MKTFILVVVCLVIGWYSGAAYIRWSIAQMFGQGEGRAICETILREQRP